VNNAKDHHRLSTFGDRENGIGEDVGQPLDRFFIDAADAAWAAVAIEPIFSPAVRMIVATLRAARGLSRAI
jgi:hypothetical protein